MGVKNLWDILECCKKTIPLHHLQNKRLCVDLSCWIVQLHNVNKSHCPLKDKVYLKGLFHRLRALIALNCSLIFVTDGSIPAIKLSTYRRRLNSGHEAIQDAQNPGNVTSVKRNMGSEFSCMIKEAKFLGMALGIPCLNGFEEAEAQCALLNSESLCDGCITSDSDAFLFGARTVYRDICLGEGGYVVCYEMDDIERELGFGRNSLIALAILLGSDYTHGVRGFGPESACQIVKSIGDPVVLQRFASEGLSIVRKQKSSRKKGQSLQRENKENNADHGRDSNGNECGLPMDNQVLQVINAYLKPKCHSADSDVVHRVLALFPFNRSQLHQICAQYFAWPPEKIDEYVLPKIGERNLRRFANLRSTSSGLGLHLPINEMPVRCPVSSIVKQRKIQGRDYFEVSWEDMDGLKTSSVPADLVESACPEKITEFRQRKAQKQKPTRRSRPKNVDMKEIDKKLQELLLDIEQESSTITRTLAHVDVDEPRFHLSTKSESTLEGEESSSGCNSAASRYLETEIIDLISPPQQKHKVSKREGERQIHLSSCQSKLDKRPNLKEVDENLHKLLLDTEQESSAMTKAHSLGGLLPQKTPAIAKVNVDQQRIHFDDELESSSRECEEIDSRGSYSSSCFSTTSKIIDLVSPAPRVDAHEVQICNEVRCVNVIELSDTDSDASPEHARKVKELRLFIANIRDEIS